MSDIGWHRRLILLVICGALFCCCNSSDLSSANDAVHGKRPFVNISGDIKLGGLVAIYDSGGQVRLPKHKNVRIRILRYNKT